MIISISGKHENAWYSECGRTGMKFTTHYQNLEISA
jgi:hypothetical protein